MLIWSLNYLNFYHDSKFVPSKSQQVSLTPFLHPPHLYNDNLWWKLSSAFSAKALVAKHNRSIMIISVPYPIIFQVHLEVFLLYIHIIFVFLLFFISDSLVLHVGLIWQWKQYETSSWQVVYAPQLLQIHFTWTYVMWKLRKHFGLGTRFTCSLKRYTWIALLFFLIRPFASCMKMKWHSNHWHTHYKHVHSWWILEDLIAARVSHNYILCDF